MTSKKKNVKVHFRRRSLERVGMIVDEQDLIRKIQNQELEFVYSQSLRRKVYRVEFLEQKFLVIYDKVRKQLITIFPEDTSKNDTKILKTVMSEVDLIINERCKQLPKIETLQDCQDFYHKFYDLNLCDINYGDESHKSFKDKPIEELTRDEVLTSFTIIQREDYWEGGYGDSVFKKYLDNKSFERLYSRLQEVIREVENEVKW